VCHACPLQKEEPFSLEWIPAPHDEEICWHSGFSTLPPPYFSFSSIGQCRNQSAKNRVYGFRRCEDLRNLRVKNNDKPLFADFPGKAVWERLAVVKIIFRRISGDSTLLDLEGGVFFIRFTLFL
ncbi:MAG TPA: hypothetical protein VGB07_05370, partial [Blastocatellia bacterium]